MGLVDNAAEVWYNSICGKPNASVRAFYALASGMTAGILCGSCGRLLSSGVFVIVGSRKRGRRGCVALVREILPEGGRCMIISHVIEKIIAGFILLVIFFCYVIAEVHNMKK